MTAAHVHSKYSRWSDDELRRALSCARRDTCDDLTVLFAMEHEAVRRFIAQEVSNEDLDEAYKNGRQEAKNHYRWTGA